MKDPLNRYKKGWARGRIHTVEGWLTAWLTSGPRPWSQTACSNRPALFRRSKASAPAPQPAFRRKTRPHNSRLVSASARLSLSLAGGGLYKDVISARAFFPRQIRVHAALSSVSSMWRPGVPQGHQDELLAATSGASTRVEARRRSASVFGSARSPSDLASYTWPGSGPRVPTRPWEPAEVALQPLRARVGVPVARGAERPVYAARYGRFGYRHSAVNPET